MKNTIDIKIKSLNAKGEGVGRHENLVVFVPHSVPGDVLEVQVISNKPSYARAVITKIIKPSDFRIKPLCPKSGECGGCQIQEMNYDRQLIEKKHILEDAFSTITKVASATGESVIPSKHIFNYRNKCQYPVQNDTKESKSRKLLMGYYASKSHKIINYDACHLHPNKLNRTMVSVKQILEQYRVTGYDETENIGMLRHIIGRYSFDTGKMLIGFVTHDKMPNGDKIATDIMRTIPDCIGVVQNINNKKTNAILGETNVVLGGVDNITEKICNIEFNYSLSSFFQINTYSAEKMHTLVKKIAGLKGEESIIDAYCGVGSFALTLAGSAGKIYGIEEVKPAVANAINNAKINNIKNCYFKCDSVEKIMPEIIKKAKQDLIIFDPPREGVKAEILELVADNKIPKIIYVSCHPGTLARDARILMDKGYSLTFCRGVDMFPHTYHVETVAMFQI